MHSYCYFVPLLTSFVDCVCVFEAATALGELLFLTLHHVTPSVSHMARVALLFMCVYPLLDMTVSGPTPMMTV